MKNKLNIPFIALSLLPVVYLLVVYTHIIDRPSSKINGGPGSVDMSKPFFALLIAVSSIFYYYISAYLADRLVFLYAGISPFVYRLVANLLLAGTNLLLIFSNLNA